MVKSNQSLRRGLEILRAFNEVEPATLGNLADATGMSKATLLRYLRTLEDEGYVAQDRPARAYRLSPMVFELGFAALASMEVPKLVEPYMDGLALDLGVTANLGRLDGAEVVMVARVFAPADKYQPTPIHAPVGSRLPAVYTAMGRLLLSRAPETARRIVHESPPRPLTPHALSDPARILDAVARAGADGHALVRDELVPGYSNLAVPIEVHGHPPYALSITVPSADYPTERLLNEMLPRLRSVAAQAAGQRHVVG